VNHLIRRLAPLALAFAVVLPTGTQIAGAEPVANKGLAREKLVIATSRGPVRLKVEVARTPAQQERGLMFRDSLPPDGGMIFPFKPPVQASFWMKNTKIPLDMIFIRGDGTISGIAYMTTPYSLEPVISGEPVVAVLEIAGGRAKQLGIEVDNKVHWGPLGR
jgi:uncharacterized membrane protein (UPF0127 family)